MYLIMQHIITSYKMWLNKQSLAFKLSISILVCVFIVFTMLVLFLSNRTEHIVGSKTEEMGIKSVQSYVNDITHLAFDTEQLVLNTKNMLNQLPEQDIASLKLVLNSTIKTFSLSAFTFTDAWVYMFSPEDVSSGILYRASQARNNITFQKEVIKNFYDIFPWFKRVPKTEEIFWSEPYLDKISGKTVVTCLLPFMFKNSMDFDGLVAVTVDLSQMTNSINSFSFAEKGKLLLVSRTGLYIAHPNPHIALKMTLFQLSDRLNIPELADAGREVLSGRSGTKNVERSSVFYGSAIFFYAPVSALKWGLFLVYSENDLIEPIKHIKYLMVIPLFIGMLILFFFINRICHRSTRHLLTLSSIASQYGQGNFAPAVNDITSSDEIGILAKAMSEMRTNLLTYIQKEKDEAQAKQKSASELLIAQNIQQAALSVNYPAHDAFQISTRMIPARQVGGDFYDFFFVNKNNFAILVADVSGKGIPAALYMMKAQTLIKNIVKDKTNLSDAFLQINNELCEGNDSCMFVSVFIAIINIFTGHVEYLNAGHTHPLLYNNDSYSFLRPETNVVLGVRKNFHFTSQTLKMKPHDRLFLYTDGVTEAENTNANLYGEARLQKTLAHKPSSPDDTLNTVYQSILRFADNAPQSDDITMLEFCYQGMNGDTLTVPADTKQLSRIITFLKQDMDKKHICHSAQFRMILSAEEIFSNIAEHAYTEVQNGETDIITNMQNNIYTAAFVDSGTKYNPLKRPNPTIVTDLANRKIGGLGIFLAKKFADNIEYFYDHNHNVLKIAVINIDRPISDSDDKK